MHGEHVIVTGATSGIGKEAARELVRRGAKVGIIGRNPAKTEGAAAELGVEEVFIADLAELDQVRQVAKDVAARWPRLDVLVNNAGINATMRERTSDGLDPMVATNFLSPFLLTSLLLAPLRAGSPSRVVNVASEAHRFADRLDPATIRSWGPATNGLQQNRLYGRTKLALLLVMQELAERVAGDGIHVSSCCPGLVATNLAGSESRFTHASTLLARTPLVRRPEQGAAVVVRLASDPAQQGQTGGFHTSTPGAGLLPRDGRLRDRDLQRRVFAAATELLGLPQP
ncbi:MAG: SDR family NAD(P)-dependent oxidoreductase [Acidimicrobiales bacterium]